MLPQTLPFTLSPRGPAQAEPPSLQGGGGWGLASKATAPTVQVIQEEKGRREFLNFNGISPLLLISQVLFISQFELSPL